MRRKDKNIEFQDEEFHKSKKNKKQKYIPSDVQYEGQSVKLRHILKPKNETQLIYIDTLKTADLTICSGPAGSGKTWIATYIALKKLIAGEVEKIILTRPTVETGTKLGYLPGTLEEKMDPYLRPLFDAMKDHMGAAGVKRLMESGKIEISPLAYMRGRNFRNSFMLLDESQNATVSEIQMFLTRSGEGSIMAINGDVTQCDLEKPRNATVDWCNGLSYAIKKLSNKDECIQYVEFMPEDIIRSELVKKIIHLLNI